MFLPKPKVFLGMREIPLGYTKGKGREVAS